MLFFIPVLQLPVFPKQYEALKTLFVGAGEWGIRGDQ
jgi:hypothetical protein